MPEVSYFLAASAGFASFLSPCVLPLVLPYFCFLTGLSAEQMMSGRNQWHTFKCACFFCLGFSLVFVVLGASASFFGGAIRELMTVTLSLFSLKIGLLQALSGLLILGMGGHFLGVWRFSFLLQERRWLHFSTPPGFLGSFAMGIAFSLGWTPCIGPILATILSVAALQESWAQGMFLLACYALGLAVPFLMASLAIEKFFSLSFFVKKRLFIVEKMVGFFFLIVGTIIIFGGMPWISSLFLSLSSP